MKQHPRSLPWLVEIHAELAGVFQWWIIDQYGTEANAIARMNDIVERGDAWIDVLRVRFDPTPEDQTSNRK